MALRLTAGRPTPARPSARDRGAEAVARALLRCARRGTVVLKDGDRLRVYGRGQPTAHVVVHDPRVYRAVLASGSVGLGHSYIEGWWDADDLTTLLRILLSNLRRPLRVADAIGRVTAHLASRFDAAAATADREADRANVRAHYDVSNEFFSLMLDETMAYSCAVFERPDAELADAQRAKLERICRALDLSSVDHVVEIGTGWGSFAVHAARQYGCAVTTTTISDAQFAFASQRIAREGLAPLVTVLRDDYRDLRGAFDKLVSIEMIEAIGWRQMDTYFETCARLLRPGGLMALQAIVITDASYERTKRHDDFIKRYVFPGGFLPSRGAITSSARRAGFDIVRVDEIGEHYPETLRRWRANVHAHVGALGELGLDDAFLRLWEMYLSYCEAGFLEHHVGNVQVVLRRR